MTIGEVVIQGKNHEDLSWFQAIIKNPEILIIWLNAFVEIVSALFLLSYGPTYIKYVLNIRFLFCFF